MRAISLLTDFGLEDNFVGVIKAVVFNINPKVRVIDICHNIKPHNILEAAFLLKGSHKYFPKQTIHLVIVDPGVGSSRRPILVKTADYYYIGPDNGVLSLVLREEKPDKIIEITNEKYFLKPVSRTFHGRDIFAPVAAHLSAGEKIENFGKKITRIKEIDLPKIKIDKNVLLGEVIYIDRFGNLVTNIDRAAFRRFTGQSRFRIKIKNKTIVTLSHSYLDAELGQPLAIFGSFANLEISINQGSAKKYFQAREGLRIKINRI